MPYGTSNKRWHHIRKDHGETHTLRTRHNSCDILQTYCCWNNK